LQFAELESLLSALAPISPMAFEAFNATFSLLLALAQEKLTIELRYHKPIPRPDQELVIKGSVQQFGEMLSSIYRYGLYRRLAEESAWFSAMLMARGLGPEILTAMIEGWIISIHAHIKPPECDELARPLEVLLKKFPFKQMNTTPVHKPDLNGDAVSLLPLLLSQDSASAHNQIKQLRNQGLATVDIISKVILPAMREIGQRWLAAEIGVSQEHVASEIARKLIISLGPGFAPMEPSGRTVLVSCVPGEEHDLGVMALSIFLEAGGWRVSYPGRSMPIQELTDAVKKFSPDVVFLSLTMLSRLYAAISTAVEIKKTRPKTRVILGGNAARAAEEIAGKEIDGIADTFEQAHEMAGELISKNA
jgi:MerR family transcriptional regulator, light-induced transcriptional regulator